MKKEIKSQVLCPCGSQKRYGSCCKKRGIKFLVDEQGSLYKSIPMTPELRDLLERKKTEFIKEHGHEPGPDDPVFPSDLSQEELTEATIKAMREAGIDPAMIYAYMKTGLIVTEYNQKILSARDLAEWDNAIAEYRRSNEMKK